MTSTPTTMVSGQPLEPMDDSRWLRGALLGRPQPCKLWLCTDCFPRAVLWAPSTVATTIVDAEQLSYVARIGDSTGYSRNDWVAGNTTEDMPRSCPTIDWNTEPLGHRDPLHLRVELSTTSVIRTSTDESAGKCFEMKMPMVFNNQGRLAPECDSLCRCKSRWATQRSQLSPRTGSIYRRRGTDQCRNWSHAHGRQTRQYTNRFTSAQMHGFRSYLETQPVCLEGIPWFDDTERLRIDFYRPASSVTIQFSGTSTLTRLRQTGSIQRSRSVVGLFAPAHYSIIISRPHLSFASGVIAYA